MDESQQFETIHAGHVDIRDEAIDLRKMAAGQQCSCRRKQMYGVVRRFEEIFERVQDAVIVIDDRYDEAGSWVSHCGWG